MLDESAPTMASTFSALSRHHGPRPAKNACPSGGNRGMMVGELDHALSSRFITLPMPMMISGAIRLVGHLEASRPQLVSHGRLFARRLAHLQPESFQRFLGNSAGLLGGARLCVFLDSSLMAQA